MNNKEDSEKNSRQGGQFFENPMRSVREEGSYGHNTADSSECGVLDIVRYKLYLFNFYLIFI